MRVVFRIETYIQTPRACFRINLGNLQDFEIKFLKDLCSAVSVDSHGAVLKAAAAIPLGNSAGAPFSLALLLGYVTRVAKFFKEVPAGPTARFESKAACAP